MRGFYFYNHIDVKTMKILQEKFNSMIEQLGYLPYVFPTIGTLENFQKEKNHFKLNAEVFKIEGKNWILKPTSESVSYPELYGNASLQLPFKWYQQNSVFRNETKDCEKYIRAKEISFFHEAHSVFSTEELAKDQIRKVFELLKKFLQFCKIPFRTYLRPKEDTFPGAKFTIGFDTWVKDKPVQIMTLHYLGDSFSKVYRRGKNHLYGLCFGWSERILGVLKQLYGSDWNKIHNPYNKLVFILPGFHGEGIKISKFSEVNKHIENFNPNFFCLLGAKEVTQEVVYKDPKTKKTFSSLEADQYLEKTRGDLYEIIKTNHDREFQYGVGRIINTDLDLESYEFFD